MTLCTLCGRAREIVAERPMTIGNQRLTVSVCRFCKAAIRLVLQDLKGER